MTNDLKSVVSTNGNHINSPDISRFKAKQCIEELKESATTKPDQKASEVFQEMISKVSDEEARAKFTKKDSIKRMIRRYQGKNFPTEPKSLDIIEGFSEEYASIDGNDWLIKDVGNEDRQFIFGTKKGLQSLSQSPFWIGDGTFKVMPSTMLQLYTIHGCLNQVWTPCVYSMMKRKSKEAYITLLNTSQL